jgi:serine/threonine protein phosphatase 1
MVGKGEERFNVIHAEFLGPDEALEDALEMITTETAVPMCLTFGRDLINGKADPECQEGLSLTFCGHTPSSQIGKIGSQVFIDTGAYLAQRSGDYAAHGLTIIEPRTATVWRSAAPQ